MSANLNYQSDSEQEGSEPLILSKAAIRSGLTDGLFEELDANAVTDVRSSVWRNLKKIKCTTTNSILSYVKCITCFNIFSNTPSSGTSHLSRHAKLCSEKKRTHDENSDEIPYLKDAVTLSKIKKDLTGSLVKWSALDLRSFQVSSGDGFRDVAQKLLNIGCNFGHVQIADILCSPRTVSRNTTKMYRRVMQELLPEITAIMEAGKYITNKSIPLIKFLVYKILIF